MNQNMMLEAAKKRFFRWPDDGFSAKVAQETLTIGLAKILFLQEQLGYEPDAIIACLPGVMPTGGKDRLQRGYSLGAVLKYGFSSFNKKSKEPLVILDPKVNYCGVLMGCFKNEIPSKESVTGILKEISRSNPKIEGVDLAVDKYFFGNHFLNFYQEGPEEKHWLLIHGSGEIRKDNCLGMGIYIDESPQLQAIAYSFLTPFGPIYYLLGDTTERFMKQCKKAEEISVKARDYLAGRIIPDLEISFNESHLSISEPGNYFLGAYNITAGRTYPFLLCPQEGVALVEAQTIFSDGAIDILGWREQSIRENATGTLKSINGLPHGGRKIYGHERYDFIRVSYDGNKILYHLLDGREEIIVDNLKELGPITYCGMGDLRDIKRLGLANEIGRLRFGKGGYSLNKFNWT
jgi:hypothetical protein